MVKTKLKPYMGFSRPMGSQECACLVFAHNIKEAKKYAFVQLKDWDIIDDEWINVAVRWMKNKDFIYGAGNFEKLKNNIPHVIDSPRICNRCELWGNELDDESGLCEDCWEELKDRIY